MSIWLYLFAALLGVVAVIVVPLVSRRAAAACRGLGLWVLKRGAIVVSDNGEASLKQMSFSDLGLETIRVNGQKKDFEDPAVRLSRLAGFPFALASEAEGVLFAPPDAAAGEAKRRHEQHNNHSIPATEHDFEEYGVDTWMPWLFGVPTAGAPRLRAVRRLVWGGERADYPQRVQEFYKKAAEAGGRGITALIRVLLPVAVLFGGVLLMWYIGGQSGGVDETVGPGAAMLFAALTSGSGDDEDDEEPDTANDTGGITAMDRADVRSRLAAIGHWLRRAVLVLAGAVVILGPPVLIGVVASPLLAVILSGLFIAGAVVAVILVVGLGLFASETIATALWRVGLLPLDEPVLHWTPAGYLLVDATDDDSPVSPADISSRYRIAKHRVGVTYSLDDADWEAIERDDRIESVQLPNTTESAVPDGYLPTEYFGTGPYGGFVPKRIKRSDTYLNAQILLGEWQGSAEGDKSIRRLTEAKDEYGGASLGLSDVQLLLATLAAGVVSMGAGYFVFF